MTIEEAKIVSMELMMVSKQWKDEKYYTGNIMVDYMAEDAAKTIDWLIGQIESGDK